MGEKALKRSPFGYPPIPHLRYGNWLFSDVWERRKQAGPTLRGSGVRSNGKKEKAGSCAVRKGRMNLFWWGFKIFRRVVKAMMTHSTLLTRYSRENKVYLLGMVSRRTRTADSMRRKGSEGWFKHCALSHDQARCIHPPFVECFTIQAFSIASDFDPKLMPKKQSQITMRKVWIVIQSLLSRRPNHHSGYR